MKKSSQNSFGNGLKTDLSPLSTPNDILTDAINTTLVTYNGNEFILQSLIGNSKIENLDFNGGIEDLRQIKPIAAKEYNGVLYIVLKALLNGTLVTGIGTYCGDVETFEPNKFSFIKNLYKTTLDLPDNFLTVNLPLSDEIDLEIQEAVDLSVNLIINDSKTGIYLINTGAENTLSEYIGKYIDDSTLSQQLSLTKNITTLGKCEFKGVNEGGTLPVGTYFFYFKYVDGLDNESEIFTQEGPIMLYIGSPLRGIESLRGGLANENSNKSISLQLFDLDPNFESVAIYYSRETSDMQESITTSYKKIVNNFKFSGTNMQIVITGLEETEDITYDQLNTGQQEIKTCKSIVQSNGYLFGANLDNSTDKDTLFRNLASEVTLKEIRDQSDNIGNLPLYQTTGGLSYTTIKITDEQSYIDELLVRVKNGLSKNIAFILTKDLTFTLENTAYQNELKNISTKPFEGILHGSGFTINATTNLSRGALFPYCKKATIRDLNTNIQIKPNTSTDEITFTQKQWKFADGSLYTEDDKDTSALCAKLENTEISRVTVKATIEKLNRIYNISDYANIPISNYSFKIINNFGYLFNLCHTGLNVISTIDSSSKLNDVIVDLNVVLSSSRDITTFSSASSYAKGKMSGTVGVSLCSSIRNSSVNNLIINYDIKGKLSTTNCFPPLYHPVLTDGPNTNYSNIICGNISTSFPGLGLPTNPYTGQQYNPTIFAFPESTDGNRVPAASVSNIGFFRYYNYNNLDRDVLAAYNKLNKIIGNWSGDRVTEFSQYFLNSNIRLTHSLEPSKTTPSCSFIVYTEGEDDLNPPEDSFEYYSPINITNKLGYWANEYYRFGIQFIDNLGHKSNVYDLKGSVDGIDNSFGVFKTTNTSQISNSGIVPIGFKPVLTDATIEALETLGIKGYVILRQPRIPTILCQGLTISRLKEAGLPFFHSIESMQGTSEDLKKLNTSNLYQGLVLTDESVYYKVGGIISPDLNLNSEYYSGLFTGTSYKLVKPQNNIGAFSQSLDNSNEKRLFYSNDYLDEAYKEEDAELLFIPENCYGLNIKGNVFKTVAGDAKLNYSYEYLEKPTTYATRFLRGKYSAYLGIVNGGLFGNLYYNKIVNIENKREVNDEITIRSQDNNAYFPVSKARYFTDNSTIYKGDCFIGTYYQRLSKNFITADAPFQDGIIKTDLTFAEGAVPNSEGYGKPDDFKDVNLADLNAVRMGQWVGFKCCSNVNHIYRTLDLTRPSERALFSKNSEEGDFAGARGFYPYYEATSAPYNKLLDSTTMNSGYNRTLSRLASYNLASKYSLKKEFPTRVFYSRRHFGSSLINNYRIFDLLSFRDYPTNMGSIVKIMDLFGNLLIIFERGVGLAPIQERVAMGGGDGGNLFINSSQVLPERLLILSDKYGSTHKTSVVRTPFGVYGVDIEQRKIWRTNGKNFELISDFTIQKLLNDTLKNLQIKTFSFNNSLVSYVHPYKNDVYFSFNLSELKEVNKDFSIVYSEVANCWSTKTKWTVPLATNYRNNLLTVRKDRTLEDTGDYYMWEHGVIKTQNRLPGKFFNKKDNTEIEFIVGHDSINTQKIFENLKIISNNYFPSSIIYSITQGAYNPINSEIEVSTTQTLLDMRKYGRVKGNAMYKENILNVTIKALPPKIQFPNWSGDSSVANIKKEARIRDKYLRVKLIYDNSDIVTIHSVLTLFNPSFS